MKKIIIAMVGGVMLFAGPSNYVGLSDIKDALYYLIKDYKALLKSSNQNKKHIEKVENEMNKEFENIKITIKKRNIKVDNEIKQLLREVSSLKRRALLIREKEDNYDKYISNYVNDNKEILEKINNKK
jgi:esterase/lipase